MDYDYLNDWEHQMSRPNYTSPVSILPQSKVEIINDYTMVYIDKNSTEHIVVVYDITYDSSGYPLFLIYLDGQWIRKSAKYFKPMKGENK